MTEKRTQHRANVNSVLIGGRRRLAGGVALGVAVVLTAAACGEDAGVTTEGVWARTSPTAATSGAVYFDITSDEADRLIAVSVPAEVAGTVEIHETVMMDDGHSDDDMSEDEMAEDEMAEDDDMSEDEMAEDDGMEGGEHSDGAMMMQELAGGLELPAGETVSLEPGGLHIMLLDLPDPLETGETFDLTLDFESGASEVVSVEVREEAP